MAAVTVCSDFGNWENNVCNCFHCFPIYLPWSDGTRCHDLSFLNKFSSVTAVQSLSHVQLCDPMDCSMPGFLSLTISWSLPKFMSIKSMMPSNHLILCHPLVFLPSISPSIRVFYKDIIVIIATIVTSHGLLNFLSSVSQCVQRLHTSKLTTCLLLNQVLGTLLQKTESESLKVNPRNLKINKLSLDISKSWLLTVAGQEAS